MESTYAAAFFQKIVSNTFLSSSFSSKQPSLLAQSTAIPISAEMKVWSIISGSPLLISSGLLSLFEQPDLYGMLLFPAVAGSGALIGRKNVIPFCISDMINAFKSGGVRLIVLSIEYSSKRQRWSLAKRLLMRSLSIFRSK